MRAPRKRQHQPGVEPLEGRALLAGNVTVALTSGNIVITGDSLSNGVEIDEPSLDHYRVRGTTAGGSATRINGSTGGTYYFNYRGYFYPTSSFTGAIKVAMNAGDDSVYIHGTDSGDGDLDAPKGFSVDMGAGNDRADFTYLEAQTGDFFVHMSTNTGGGTERVNLNSVEAANDVKVFCSYGSKVVANLNYVTAGHTLNVDLGNGSDVVNINSADVYNLNVTLYDGNDSLSVRRTKVRSTWKLDGGNGTDNLNYYANTPSTMSSTAFLSPTRYDRNY